MTIRNGVQTIGSGRALDVHSLKLKAESDPKSFIPQVREITGLDHRTGNALSGEEAKKRYGFAPVRLSDVGSLRELRDVLRGVEVQTRSPNVTTGAFPALASSLAIREVTQAYESVPTVGQELVTDIDDHKKQTFLVNLLHKDNENKKLLEGDDYPLMSADEEKFSVGHRRNGRRMQITEETLMEIEAAGFAARLTGLGSVAADEIEELTLERVSGTSVLTFKGSATTLFASNNTTLPRLGTSGNLVTSNALMDASDLENARLLLAAMKNGRKKRIYIPTSRMKLLVPDALLVTADKILGSEMTPGVRNELNPWGPRGRHRPGVVSSPKLDDVSTSAWYLGDFAAQFVRKFKKRPTIAISAGTGTDAYVRCGQAMHISVSWDCEVGCRDYVYVVKSTA